MKEKSRILFELEKELHEKFKQLTDEKGMKMNKILQNAIKKWIEENE